MKNLKVINPPGLVTVPARAVGIDPRRRSAAKTYLGPNLSQAGPATPRTSKVARSATTFEFATSTLVAPMSLAMVKVSSGGNAYQDQKATKKPNQAKLMTRPYMLMGLRTGIDRAFRLMGFISGACQSNL